jgi:hypothetical protein
MCDMQSFEIAVPSEPVNNLGPGAENYSQAQERGEAMLTAYGHALDPGEPLETVATDLVADILRAVPEEDWHAVIRSALLHAHEEIHGWGSARGLSVSIDGLEHTAAA